MVYELKGKLHKIAFYSHLIENKMINISQNIAHAVTVELFWQASN